MIKATIKDIQNVDNLNIVKFDFYDTTLTMMSLELNDSVRVGTKAKLAIKPTHVAVAKNLSGELSYSNQLKAKVTSIENGKLLSSIKLKYFDTIIESIITSSSSKRMNLHVEDDVIVLIKASELSISEICDD